MTAQQKTVKSQKRRGPAPTGKGTPILVRLQPDLLNAMARVSADSARWGDHKISRPELIRVIVREWLTDNGYIDRSGG